MKPKSGVAGAHSIGSRRVSIAPGNDWSQITEAEHVVQFYEQDGILLDSVAAFLDAGLRSGEAGVVIATAEHRRGLEERLLARDFDLPAMGDAGLFISLDAAEVLDRFMTGRSPDPQEFRRTLGEILAQAGQGRRRVRFFGEMVALLWEAGNHFAVIQLEDFWNEAIEEHGFSLFCAYPIRSFSGTDDAAPFEQICRAHSRVIPAEGYTSQTTEAERLRVIAGLQQKAARLEAEVAERQLAERALREQQAKLELAVAVAQVGIWELDLRSGELTASVQCKAHFGLEPAEPFSSKLLFERVQGEDRASLRRALRAAVAGKSDVSAEFRIEQPDGRVVWILLVGRYLHKGDGRFLGVTRNITSRKTAAETLEQMVAQRTSELRESMTQIEAYSHSISHDLRAPLRAMHSYAQIVMEEHGSGLVPECRRLFDRIILAAARMDRMIEDVLSFSRVSRVDDTLVPIDMDRLLVTILETSDLAPVRGRVNIARPLPDVLGSEVPLTQCLTNLLGNAVKFVLPGVTPEVRVWAESIEVEGEERVRLFIRDNGIGIPEHAHQSVFEIFRRLEVGYEGTGIGLAIVKRAVERMGGRVGLASAPGQGSTFWVELRPAGASAPPFPVI